MPRLPFRFAATILTFAPLFLQRSWRHAEVLLTGAILAPGQRTVRVSGSRGTVNALQPSGRQQL